MAQFKSRSGYQPIENKLFLNYLRPIGRIWKGAPVALSATGLISGSVKAFYEALVPSSSDEEYSSLTAMSNSLFIEARRHNMSLSPFGHLDPVKFSIAMIYPPLLLAEIRRDLGIAGEYQFNNVAHGEQLARAAGFDFNDALNNYVSYEKKYNILVARVNALMIPKISLMNRWLDHRLTVFKDDEGERYQYYLYKMANYYKLIVDPTDPEVGRLKCMWDIAKYETLAVKLARVEAILASYESDDDMVTFATEAIQAGMGHIEMEPIPVEGDGFAKVEFITRYSLDDIMSLENAKFVYPITKGVISIAPGSGVFNWDIWENIATGKFVIGTTNTTVNKLPVVHPIGGHNLFQYKYFNSYYQFTTAGFTGALSVDQFPIYTHAKVKSIEGLTKLTRYLASVAAGSSTNNSTLDIFFNGGNTTVTPSNDVCVSNLTLHSTELIVGLDSVEGGGVDDMFTVPVTYHFVPIRAGSSAVDSSVLVGRAYCGFKAVTTLYAMNQVCAITGYVIQDFDYITSTSEDVLTTFFGVNGWNDMRLDDASISISASKNVKDVTPSEEK